MFGTGGFGNTAASTGGGGFGGFGQASGGGGTGGNAGGGTFGRFGASSSTGGSAFGSTSTAPGTSSLFGSSSNTAVGSGSGFGSTGAGGFGVSSQQQATGSARVAYEPYTERGPAGRKDVFHNICFMSAYSDASPEELRVQDYQAGRKKPDSIATGAAGSGSIFGQPASSAGGSAFGSGGGTFGAASTPSKPAAGFGAGGGFASGSGIGGFGQTSTAGATGGFGAASKPAGFGSTGTGAFGGGGLGFGNTPAAGGGGTGLFGQPAAAASSSGFGTTSTASSAFGAKPAFGSTGGAFGSSLTSQPAASTAGTTGFGASNAFGTNTGGGGGFGQTGTNTAFGAGNTATGSGGGSFGFGGGGTNAGVGGGGMFGTGNAGAGSSIFSNKPAATGFGNTSTAPTTGFGVSGTGTGAGGAFGTGGGLGVGASGGGSSLFGNKPAATGFGVTSTAAPAAFGVTSTGGAGNLFGGTSTAGTGGGSLFGTTTNTAGTGGGPFGTGSAGGTSLFGQTGTANTGSSSLFGTANTGVGAASGAGAGGGLFGTTTNAAPSAGGGFFAAKPAATTSLGGGGSLFGTSAPATNTALAPSAAGGSLFGTAGAGAATNPTGTAGGGLFGTGGSGFSTAGGGIGTSGGGGLFGIKPAASLAPGAAASSGGGLFGTSTGGGGLFSTQQPAQQLQQQQQSFPQQQQQPAQSFGMFGAQQPQQQQAQGAQQGLFTTQIDRQPYGANALFDTTRLANKAAAGGSGLSRFSSHLTATPLRAAATEGASDKEAERKKRGLTLAVVASPAASSTVGSRLRARGFAASSTAAKKRVPGVPVPPTPAMAPRTRAGTTIGIFGRDGFLAPDTQLPHASVKRLVITRRPSFGASSAAAATPAPASSATPAPAPAPGQTPGPRVADPWAISQSTAPTHALIEEEDGASDTPTEEADAADDDGYGEYWMRPSLDELRAMTTQQLRAVRNFTVGCGGLGQVSFSKPVDLTTVGSLSAIAGGVILFGNHVCTVYPDESNKPPRGQGLNVPAVISLHECWPTLAATGAAINDMADARVRKHIRRLRRVPETEFVDFVSGTWIFKVAHFSRYGLDDLTEDGADEEDMVPIEEIQEDQQQQVQPIRPVRAAPKQLLAGVRRAESLRRAPVMRASLFATATPAASAQPADNQAALLSFAAAPKRKRSAHSPLRASTVGSSISGADAFAPSLAALDLPPPGKYLRAGERTPAVARAQPYARSLAYGRSGMRADAGLMMARSFRAAFGPQGQLVYLQGGAARQVVVVDSVARHLHAPTRTLDEHRALHLATVSAFRAQPHDISTAAAGALAQLPESERSILDLAALLFDDAHGPAPAHVRAVRRRQGLTRWLMRAVGDAVQRDLLSASSTTGGGSVAAASVFALLTGHRIEAACLAATSHRDYRLATLVAQCGAGGVGGGGNDAQVQELVRAQLARMDASRDYRRVYELLAGAPANRVAAGLDWKRAFGLSLWYAGSPADDVADSVVRYERAFTSAEDGSVALPHPAWRPVSDDSDSVHSDIWDPAFQLLRLYSDATLPLERVLPPESFSPARGDVRMPALVAWLLFVVRKVRGFDESLAYDRLLAGWAAQLEALGLWQWACYVLLQLSSSESHRAHAICMLIERSIPSDSDFDFDFDSGVCAFLRDDLRIPESWLNDARVTRSRYDMDRTHAADIENDSGEATMHHLSCLLRAGEQAAAHSLVLQRIAPDAVLCGDYKLLRRVLADFDVSRVRDWASGGQVYESFLAGVEDLPAALERIASAGDGEDDSSMQQDIGAIYQQMVSLVAALPSLATRFESRSAAPTGFYDGCEVFLLSESEARDLRVKCSVAISDMASVVTRLIHEMEAAVGDVGARASPSSSSSTLLPLAQDMRILRTFKMARSCFDTLVGSSLVV